MRHPSGVDRQEDRYQPLPEAIIRTPFRAIHESMWEAETKFDLLFRRDHGVYVWAANRVQIYYKLAAATGIYDAQKTAQEKPTEPEEILVESLPQVDAYVQTGALGPATANRSRPYGCLYTQDYVRWLLNDDRSVLLLHDKAEDLIDHPNLYPLHSRQLTKFTVHHRHLARKKDKCALDDEGIAFWAGVDDFLYERLGVRILGADQIQTWIYGFHAQLVAQRAVFAQIRPRAFICMAHYFRAPQIRAACEVGARTIDFQHGINSKFHLGYGFPNLRSDARKIPYYPEEFWAWGNIWASDAWFPRQSCDVRNVGHFAVEPSEVSASPPERPRKTLMIATSWAMQSTFKNAATNIAARLPDWTTVLKLHPREDVKDYQPLADKHSNIRIIDGDRDVIEASREATVVLSICSSSLFDVLVEHTPIMVLESEGVEYAEDFVAAYDVPVVASDASNIAECIDRAIRRSIPVNEVFASSREQRIEIAVRSVLGEISPRPVPAEALPVPGRKGVQIKLPYWAGGISASMPRSERLKRALGITPNPLAVGRLSFAPDISQRAWNLIFRRHRDNQRKKHREFLCETIKRTREDGDDDTRHAAIRDLIKMGEPTARHRNEFLRSLYRLKRDGRQREFADGLNLLLEKARAEGAPSALPLFEYALREGRETPLLDAYGVKRHERRWRDGSALMALQNPLLAAMIATLERMAKASADEYLDGRVKEKDTEELGSYLRRRIEKGRPFAMIRLGDGEVYGMDPSGYLDVPTLEQDRAAREEIWWGRQINEDLRARLREGFMNALPQCDLIGLPSSFRLMRDLPGAIKSMRRPMEYWSRTTRAHFILFRELQRMMDEGRLDLSAKVLCDDRCHQDLFTPPRLRALLEGASHVVGVNCFTREQLNSALGGEIIHDHVLTPPHSKVRDHAPAGPLRDVAMPMLLDELLAGIDETVRPGSVVLVAGGIAGKLLIHRAKQRGGIVFDIGASADYWMGIDTRGALDFTAYR